MENGRRLGATTCSRLSRTRTVAAVVTVLLAGSLLLGSGAHGYKGNSAAVGAAPIPISTRFTSAAKPDVRTIVGKLPLIFERNEGQAGDGVKFIARGAGYDLALDRTGAVLGLHNGTGKQSRLVRMKLAGANAGAVTSGINPLPGKSNYLIGNDPQKWHRSVAQFAAVQYRNVYRGIDLVFYGSQGHLEYDFKIAPGVDASRAELEFEGANKLTLEKGDLLIATRDAADIRFKAPEIYQRAGDSRVPVSGRFVMRSANRVGFEIGSYDHQRELVIDPVLFFSTYFGGSGSETSPSVSVDPAGNIYLVGTTQNSPAASFTNAASTVQNLIPSTLSVGTASSHIFITKISPSQPPVVVYETFMGGTGSDTSVGLGVDGGGNAYIVGNTTSTDFPTGGIPYQTVPEVKGAQCASTPCTSAFVSVLNPAGSSLTYSTYLSGNGNDQASAMAIDANGDVFLTGTTTSSDVPAISPTPVDFPATFLPVPYQVAPNGPIQFFATKVNTKAPGVASIAYSTYFGGGVVSTGTVAVGGGIAIDTAGDMYFSGTTNFFNSGQGQFGDSSQSTDFPILNAYQPCLDTPPPTVLANPNPCSAPGTTPYPTDAFVAKLNPNAQAGSQLLFSTYLGGTAADSSTAIAVDPGAANIYITGSTTSSDFILPIGLVPLDSCLNNANPAGSTAACTSANTTSTDAYIARFNNPTVSTIGTPINVGLTYFSYLGGSGNDSGLAVAADTAGDALITGATSSTNFPVTVPNPLQGSLGGAQNAFFASVNTSTSTNINGVGSFVSYFGGNGTDRGTSIFVDPVSLNTYLAGDTTSTNFQTQNALQSTLNGPSDAFVAELVPAPSVCITCTAPTYSSSGNSTSGTVSAGNQLTITFTVTNQGPDLATGIFVNGTVSSGVTFTSATAGSGSCSTPVGNSVVCTIPTLQAGSTSLVSFVVTPTGPCNACSATAQVVKINNANTTVTPAIAPFQAGSYSVAVSPSSQTVAAGGIAQYTVQLSPKPVFGSNVSLSCSAVPTGASCNFTSSTLTLNGPQSTVLNLSTTPQPVTTVASRDARGPLSALWLIAPGITLLGFGSATKRFRRRWLGLLAISVFFTLILLQPSCSSGSKAQPQVSGTPTGTYSVTVTATSGSFTQSAPFQITVTP